MITFDSRYPGATLYCILRQLSDTHFFDAVGGTTEAYNAGHCGRYAFGAAAADAFGLYTAAFPELLTTAGDYIAYVYKQGGMAPDTTDIRVGSVEFYFNGIRDFIQPSPNPAPAGLCTVFIQLPPTNVVPNPVPLATCEVTRLPAVIAGAQLIRTTQTATYDAEAFQLIFPVYVAQGASIYIVCLEAGLTGNTFVIPDDAATYAVQKTS